MNMDVGRSPKVFIAYAQDSQAHKGDVLELADLLRRCGVDAEIDQYAEEERQDWNAWAIKHFKESEFILVVASLRMKAFGDGNVSTNQNRGVQAEMTVIRDFLQRDRASWTKKILPVVLPGGTLEGLPDFLGPYSLSHYRVQGLTPEGIEDLLRVITGQPRAVRPPLGPLPQLPPVPRVQRAGKTGTKVKPTLGEPARDIDQYVNDPTIKESDSRPLRKFAWIRRKMITISIVAAIIIAATLLVFKLSSKNPDTVEDGAPALPSTETPSATSTDSPKFITTRVRYELNSSQAVLKLDSNRDKVDIDTGCPGAGTVSNPVDRSHCEKLEADLTLKNGTLYTSNQKSAIALLTGDTDATQAICNTRLADKSQLRQNVDRVQPTAELCVKTGKGNAAAVHVMDVRDSYITIDFEVWRP